MECLMIFPCHLPQTVKMNFSILFTWNFHKKKTAAKTKILPRAGEINFSILFDLFWKEKRCRQNQELEKSIYQYFFNWNLKRHTLPLKPRSCQKLENSQSSKEHGWLFLPRWEHSNLPGVPWKTCSKKTNGLEDGMPDDFPVSPAKSWKKSILVYL